MRKGKKRPVFRVSEDNKRVRRLPGTAAKTAADPADKKPTNS
jgi:hypothetical protein